MKKFLFIVSICFLPTVAQAVDMKNFSDAAYTFVVTDIAHDGNIVNFTIPENARTIDSQADAVRLSGLYKGKKPDGKCPVVSSYDVSKTIQSYNMFSGKASIKATFDDSQIAKAAYDKGCLLIDDPD